MALVTLDSNAMEPQNLNLENETQITAEQMAKSFTSSHPFFFKQMMYSQVNPGYWLGLPKDFCDEHLGIGIVEMILVDQEGKEQEVKYLGHKLGLSAGWRTFSILHGLIVDDYVVFELVEKKYKFNVHIYRRPRTADDEAEIEKKKATVKNRKRAVSKKRNGGGITKAMNCAITTDRRAVSEETVGRELIMKPNFFSTEAVASVVSKEKGVGGGDKEDYGKGDAAGMMKRKKTLVENKKRAVSKKINGGGITKLNNRSSTTDRKVVSEEKVGGGRTMKPNYHSTVEVARVVLEEKCLGGGDKVDNGEGRAVFSLVEMSKLKFPVNKKPRTDLGVDAITKQKKVLSRNETWGSSTMKKGGVEKMKKPSTTKVRMAILKKNGAADGMINMNNPATAVIEGVTLDLDISTKLEAASPLPSSSLSPPLTPFSSEMKKGGGKVEKMKKPSTTKVRRVVLKKNGADDGVINMNNPATAVIESVTLEEKGGAVSNHGKELVKVGNPSVADVQEEEGVAAGIIKMNNPSTAVVESVISKEKCGGGGDRGCNDLMKAANSSIVDIPEEGVVDFDLPIAMYSQQCQLCFKWRIIRSEREFEEIRDSLLKNPFTCKMKPNMTCEVPDDVQILSCLPKQSKKKNKSKKNIKKRKSEGEGNLKRTVKRKRKVMKTDAEGSLDLVKAMDNLDEKKQTGA